MHTLALGLRCLLELKECIVTSTTVLIVFPMADNCCETSFNKFMCDVLAPERDRRCIARFKSLSSGFGIVDLYVDRFTDDSLTKVFPHFCLPRRLFWIGVSGLADTTELNRSTCSALFWRYFNGIPIDDSHDDSIERGGGLRGFTYMFSPQIDLTRFSLSILASV